MRREQDYDGEIFLLFPYLTHTWSPSIETSIVDIITLSRIIILYYSYFILSFDIPFAIHVK